VSGIPGTLRSYWGAIHILSLCLQCGRRSSLFTKDVLMDVKEYLNRPNQLSNIQPARTTQKQHNETTLALRSMRMNLQIFVSDHRQAFSVLSSSLVVQSIVVSVFVVRGISNRRSVVALVINCFLTATGVYGHRAFVFIIIILMLIL
jgi:hypothetical protein